VISRVFICYYTESFTNENTFHKIVHILQAISRLGRIVGKYFHNAPFRSFIPSIQYPHVHTALLIPETVVQIFTEKYLACNKNKP